MNKTGSLLRLAVMVSVITIMVVLGLANREVQSIQQSAQTERPDLILIDTMKALGETERPPVAFLHDLHTQAVEKQKKDCKACHLSDEKKRLSPKFKRLKDENAKQVMDIYHTNCIECHTQTASMGEKTGPLVCGGCHKQETKFTSSRQPVGMDKSLHYRHSLAQEDKCEKCHHEYNEETKELFHAKGKEGTCRYCHKQKPEENRMSMRQASHLQCIDCHQKTKAQQLEAGPDKCGGCHDLDAQNKIKQLTDVPRMKRNQPNVVFVKKSDTPNEAAGTMDTSKEMKRVPFAHKTHETYNDTCRVCHHAGMQTCSSCHTMIGGKDGGFIPLSAAMHQVKSSHSCLGCHNIEKADKKCAGCHTFIQNSRKDEDSSCLKCHMKLPPGTEVTEPPKTDKPDSKGQTHFEDPVAKMLLESRDPVMETYSTEDVPEKVTIKVLENEYQPVELPHRKIVDTLMAGIKENKLTQFFHADKGTLCQGCHHNSPPSKNPPKCGSCHGKPFNEKDLHKPGLMAAFHQQCMGCHYEMGLEKPVSTDCISCHKEKGKLNMGF